jgi:hypothetical protein
VGVLEAGRLAEYGPAGYLLSEIAASPRFPEIVLEWSA